MKRIHISIILLLCVLTMNGKSYAQNEFPVVKGPYLGQTPPGSIPIAFAPGIISTKHLEIEAVFAPGMQEFYFVRQIIGDKPKLYTLENRNGVWHQSIAERPSGEAFISPDGKTMHLGNNYKERRASGWSEAKSLGPLFDKFPIMRLTASAAGTYVFDEREEIGTIRYSRLIDGKREKPKAFSNVINRGKWTSHPFIAPDESYLIWDSELDGGYGSTDLHISFRQENGSWGPAINMGEDINTEYQDAYGSVTPDGKYLFFQTIDLDAEKAVANIFWVDAQVIEALRPK